MKLLDEKNTKESKIIGIGEMADLIRNLNWDKTSLGPISTWPSNLLTTVNICLNSKFPFLIWWGKDLSIIYNDGYIPIAGSKHPAILGKPGHISWGEPEVWNVISPMLNQVLNGGEATWSEDEVLLLNRNGFLEETYFTWSYSPIHNDDGTVGGVLTSLKEVTETVITARRLAHLRELGNQTVNATSTKTVCTTAGEVLGQNPFDIPFAALYLLDPDKNELMLQSTSGIENLDWRFPQNLSISENSDESAWPIVETIKANKQLILNNLKQKVGELPGGPFADYSDRAVLTPLISSDQKTLLGVIILGTSPLLVYDESYQDFIRLMTRQLADALNTAQAYEEEKKRAETLAELDRAKTAFFSNVSHEFRTPLTLMMGPLEELLNSQSSLNPHDKSELQLVHRNGLRLLKLVNTLLNFSSIEAGRTQATYHLTDISAYTAELASVFRSAIERAGLYLDVKCPKLSGSYFVDRDMFEKIILNLLSNAFKFTHNGGIRVQISEDKNGAVIEVQDTGTGIPQDELPKLFDRFHRVQGSKGRSFEGTGIGLALVKDLVRLHGGEVTVSSEVNKGTQFTVFIPSGAAHLAKEKVFLGEPSFSVSQRTAYVEEARRWGQQDEDFKDLVQLKQESQNLDDKTFAHIDTLGSKVLLVDDNSDMREYVAGILGRYWKVVSVADGALALKEIRNATYDLILTDAMMPNMDGFELIKALRSEQTTANIPVIMLSARAGEEAKVEGLEAGADDYLVKPFTARELLARVNSIIHLHKLRKQSEEKFRDLANSMPHMVFEIQPDGAITYLNRQWLETFGEQGHGHGWIETVHPDDLPRTNAAFAKGNSGKSYISVEYRLKHKDGHYEWYLGRAVPIHDEQGKIVKWYGTASNIQAYKELQHQLEEAKKRAEESSQTKSAFLANMSHEIRTPMTAVLGFTEILRDSHLSEDERLDYITRINRSGRSLLRLIDDILDISKIEAGRLGVEEVPFSPMEVVSEVVTMLRMQAAAQRTEILVKVKGNIPDIVLSDPTRIRQILVNLVGNAVKFTQNGSIIVTLCAKETDQVDQCCLSIQVTDTGIGIGKEEQKALFQPFSQADGSITRRFGGTGLGLVLSKRLAERLGGDLKLVESEKNKGSKFEVVFNVKTLKSENSVSQSEPEKMQSQKVTPSVALVGHKILVAEDVYDNQLLMRLYLQSAGAQVDIARDGQEAVSMASQQDYDLILMDVQMPVMDGLQATRNLRSQGYDKPILALTAHAMKEEKDLSLQAGCNGHLTKPIGRETLIGQVRNYIHRH